MTAFLPAVEGVQTFDHRSGGLGRAVQAADQIVDQVVGRGNAAFGEAGAQDGGQDRVVGRGDGAVISGDAWSAEVVFKVADAGRAASTLGTMDEAELCAALARVETAPAAAPGPVSISVSALLDRMGAPHDDEDAESMPGVRPQAPPKGGNALRRGSLVHALFERWDFRGAPPIVDTLEAAGLGLEVLVARPADQLDPAAARQGGVGGQHRDSR